MGGAMNDEWKSRAACRGRMDIVWHPHRPPRSRQTYVLWRENVRAAIRVCEGCPVRDECLEWSIDHLEIQGIWGGMLPSERVLVMRCPACGRQSMKVGPSGTAVCRFCNSHSGT